MVFACYGLWGGAVYWLADSQPVLAGVITTLAIAQHSSLQHEIIHGHPFQNHRLNDALVFPAIGLAIPYGRFRDTHLAHHKDSNLTDPYDDPESNFLAPVQWSGLCAIRRPLFVANNTLLGRMIIGPALGQICFMKSDVRSGDMRIVGSWLSHTLSSAIIVCSVVRYSSLPIWGYLLCAYFALSVLKIRTYLEHRAHDKSRARTVVIEDRGPLALLFLNNNLHIVHHMHPNVPWYNLPKLYANNRDRFLSANEGYRYKSYAEIVARYFLKAKDPVVHPLIKD
ncbi:MAG: fatty acid desaturase [Pseudoruegeria sp.]